MASAATVPSSTRSVILVKSSVPDGHFKNDIQLKVLPLPSTLKENEVLVQIHAAGYNHREVWQRKGLYPGIAFDTTIGADGAGVVIAAGSKNTESLIGQRVFLNPTRGWVSDPRGPESNYTALGGNAQVPLGTFTEYVIVGRDEIIPIPDHLSFEQAATWPLGGLTAWRAAFVKGNVSSGDNVLITGIGGGVALIALQLCVAAGANVYVTSSSQTKIDKAVELGAKGGVNYKSETWPAELGELLKKNSSGLESKGKNAAKLDLVIDQAGGEIAVQTNKIIREGGIIVVFGMHATPKITFTMREVLKNIELKGATMGSRNELIDATKFLEEHKLVPIVGKVLEGLEQAEEGFKLVEEGSLMGKVVIRIRSNTNSSGDRDSRL